MTDATAIISNTGTAFRNLPAAAQEAQIQETARRLVAQEVRYCVSALVSMFGRQPDGIEGLDAEDIYTLANRAPDAEDYREAAKYDDSIPGNLTVTRDEAGAFAGAYFWHYESLTDDRNSEDGETPCDNALEAWRQGFDWFAFDHPDGAECLEHWLVTDWFADKLAEHGETVARDVAGLTIWGRCTSGQAIYADGVVERIARDILEA